MFLLSHEKKYIAASGILGTTSGYIVNQDYNKVEVLIKHITQQRCQLLTIGYSGNI